MEGEEERGRGNGPGVPKRRGAVTQVQRPRERSEVGAGSLGDGASHPSAPVALWPVLPAQSPASASCSFLGTILWLLLSR